VIGEAMSAGLPVIAYDCVAGPSELIEDGGNGFLIPLFDMIHLKKLGQLMDDENMRTRMGYTGLKKSLKI
jgi:GalNAc-alpha-(1->4)-GalNAc-alpha-(1->3)-diNAcBac-PP-undecaprenol alpha-1,4-N-acetyl-D-galactosaminyltransferase